MSTLLILSFFSGVLTVLAPCVLPLLPIIIGSSVVSKDRTRPYIIILGLVLSITLFTLLLKASTLLITIDPIVWKVISGGIVFIFGLTYIFPNAWTDFVAKLKIDSKSESVLTKATSNKYNQSLIISSLLIGAALGPVFASCSPTYALIIATILPVSFIEGVLYITVYALGLGSIMLAIAIFGRKLTSKLRNVSSPNGIFKKTLGYLFVIIGIAIILGYDKILESYLINNFPFDVTKVEQNLLDRFKLR